MKIGLLSDETDLAAFFIWIQPQLKRWGAVWEVLSIALHFPYLKIGTGEIMNDWNIEDVIRRYSPNIYHKNSDPIDLPKNVEAISYADIQEIYKLMADIVTEHGEDYLPIFERLHVELEEHMEKRRLLSKAFEISNKIDEPKNQ